MAPPSDTVAKWPSGQVAKEPTGPASVQFGHFATPPPRHSQGQSIIEYLILITLVALVILALRGRVNGVVDNLYNAATDKID